MSETRCGQTSPDVPCLLAVLETHGVRYILIGSVAAQAYGVDVMPGDLDISPSRDFNNLSRLARALLAIDARLPQTDVIGHWEIQPDGERKWISREATLEDQKERAGWSPDPADITTLDHLFHTRHGELDVVPELYGGYETLGERATRMEVHGHQVWVAHVDELLAALTVPRRKKDAPRVHSLREVQRRLDG